MKVTCKIKAGRLSLGSIGICLAPGQAIELKDNEVEHLDIRQALNAGLLEVRNTEMSFNDIVFLTNISKSIISINSIRATIPLGKRVMTYTSALTNADVVDAITQGLVKIEHSDVKTNVIIPMPVAAPETVIVLDKPKEEVKQVVEEKKVDTEDTEKLVKKKEDVSEEKTDKINEDSFIKNRINHKQQSLKQANEKTGRKRGRPKKVQQKNIFSNPEEILKLNNQEVAVGEKHE